MKTFLRQKLGTALDAEVLVEKIREGGRPEIVAQGAPQIESHGTGKGKTHLQPGAEMKLPVERFFPSDGKQVTAQFRREADNTGQTGQIPLQPLPESQALQQVAGLSDTGGDIVV